MRDPLSRRGQAESQGKQLLSTLADSDDTLDVVPTTDEPAMASQTSARPVRPKGLPARVGRIWDSLLRDMIAAKIPTTQLDAETILQTARCLYAIEEAEQYSQSDELDTKARFTALSLKLKAIAESGKWLDRIGATPGARARLGMKAPVDKPMGPLAKIMAQKERTR